jgi:prepilin-type N-terminal cleavage/methylation domain-containing protein
MKTLPAKRDHPTPAPLRLQLRLSGRRATQQALSLIEILIVIAVIGVLAALFIPYISNFQSGAQESVARQQQAELQTALGNWISAASSTSGGLAAARATYTSTDNKLSLLQNYLQAATYANLQSSGNSVTSAALTGSRASLQFSSWTVGGAPSIIWVNAP